MRPVLLIEEDPLIRELMREHLEREGYAVCAVASARIGIDAARWSRFGLVLLDFASAALCNGGELDKLRSLGAPVVMMRTSPAGRITAVEGEIEEVVWSPFDLATLTVAVRRFLPAPDAPEGDVEPPRLVTATGTYLATTLRSGALEDCTTMPAPPDGDTTPVDRASLVALGELVLEATSGRRK